MKKYNQRSKLLKTMLVGSLLVGISANACVLNCKGVLSVFGHPTNYTKVFISGGPVDDDFFDEACVLKYYNYVAKPGETIEYGNFGFIRNDSTTSCGDSATSDSALQDRLDKLESTVYSCPVPVQ